MNAQHGPHRHHFHVLDVGRFGITVIHLSERICRASHENDFEVDYVICPCEDCGIMWGKWARETEEWVMP